eukprot:351537-Chlamydomonas_euryale.AAC.3
MGSGDGEDSRDMPCAGATYYRALGSTQKTCHAQEQPVLGRPGCLMGLGCTYPLAAALARCSGDPVEGARRPQPQITIAGQPLTRAS